MIPAWFAVLLLLAALLACLPALGRWRWRRVDGRIRQRFEAAITASPRSDASPSATAELPEPVRRYLALVDDGLAKPERVTLSFRGKFSLREDPPAWRPLRSAQQAGILTPALLWEGEIGFLPGFPFRVHDAYLDGRGRLHATLGGLLDVARMEAGEALAEAELLRWLAEAVWYPQALRPRAGLQWQAIDAQSARVEVSVGGLRAALNMSFDDEGLVRRIHCADRPRLQGTQMARQPWEARLGDYRRIDGVLVPGSGEVGWWLSGRYCPYWRAALESLRFGR